jgi:carbon monoxide dehydrogenase subunit G
MTSIIRQVWIDVPPATAWDALRDVGALHERLCPGFVTGTVLEGDTRVVTFSTGNVARELILGVDDEHRRVAWSVVEGMPGRIHHSSSAQVVPERGGTRFVWIADVLPAELAVAVAGLMDRGLVAIEATLAGQSA